VGSHSYENELANKVFFSHVNQSCFHDKGFAQRLVLKQRQKLTAEMV